MAGTPVTEALLKARYDFVNTACIAMMTWWVSSVAFSGALISQTWAKRDRISSTATARWLIALGTGLFGSIVIFGIGSAFYVTKLESDTHVIAHLIQPNAEVSGLEFTWLRFGIVIGTTSFAIALLAWWALGYSILRRLKPKRNQTGPPKMAQAAGRQLEG